MLLAVAEPLVAGELFVKTAVSHTEMEASKQQCFKRIVSNAIGCQDVISVDLFV